LGASYCRRNSKKGGVCMYVRENITSSQVDIKNYCIEYDMEACVLKVHLNNTIIHILTIYSSPAGDFSKFLEILDNIIRLLINPKTETVISEDINVNYLINSNRKYQLICLYVCNLSLASGIFPSRLKFYMVKPIFKKGKKTSMSNYRLISLLPFSKMFEKVIYTRLYQHCIESNILSKQQYGFRINSSTEKATFNLLITIYNALSNRIMVGGIFST
jgi:hypothetical protein